MSSYSRYSIFLLLTAVVGLVGLGLVMLASTSPWAEPEHMEYAHVKKQMIFLVLGIIASVVAAATPLALLEKFWWVFLGGSCILLALCYIPGIGIEVNGARRWIRFPLLGQFQPSEAAKVAIIISLAMWMARQQADPQNFFKGYLIPLIGLAIPAGLIFFEKDMGTTAVVVGSAFLILFVAGSRPVLLVGTAVVGIIGLIAFVNFSGGNRAERLLSFRNLEATRLEHGLQQWRSLLAFASGGVEGVGLGNGAEKHGYLPFAHTDFIYPIIGEELGLMGTLPVILAFVFISAAGILIASRSSTQFGSLLAVGLTANIVIPAAMNIGVTTAMLPNTGLPLPFVSYGGTNLIFTLVSVGIICGIYFRTPKKEAPSISLKRKRRIMRL